MLNDCVVHALCVVGACVLNDYVQRALGVVGGVLKDCGVHTLFVAGGVCCVYMHVVCMCALYIVGACVLNDCVDCVVQTLCVVAGGVY